MSRLTRLAYRNDATLNTRPEPVPAGSDAHPNRG